MLKYLHKTSVAVYDSHALAEKGVKELTDANIPPEVIHIIDRGYQADEKADNFVILVQGTTEETDYARAVLKDSNAA